MNMIKYLRVLLLLLAFVFTQFLHLYTITLVCSIITKVRPCKFLKIFGVNTA